MALSPQQKTKKEACNTITFNSDFCIFWRLLLGKYWVFFIGFRLALGWPQPRFSANLDDSVLKLKYKKEVLKNLVGYYK